MEEKTKIDFIEDAVVDIAPNIIVRKYITPSNKRDIISAVDLVMVSEETNNDITSLLYRDYALIGAIVDIMTNIDVDGMDVEKLISSGLWEKIKNSISNMGELMFDYKQLCQDRRSALSLEGRLGGIVSKIETLLDSVSKLDFSNEGIQTMTKTLGEQLGKLGEVYPQISEPKKKSKKTVDLPTKTP